MVLVCAGTSGPSVQPESVHVCCELRSCGDPREACGELARGMKLGGSEQQVSVACEEGRLEFSLAMPPKPLSRRLPHSPSATAVTWR